MSGEVLSEAYERFHGKGPEWGENRLTNHGPMVAEVLVRRGQAAKVHSWVDRYLRRLEETPAPSDRITADNWRDALGQGRRIGDWTAYFNREVRERPWREVLVAWWPRLLPGILAGATHGVIRTAHAVRALTTGPETDPASAELANGLAFWAARVTYVPGATEPSGPLEPAAALAALPRIPDQRGVVAERLNQLADLPSWPNALAGLRPAADPDEVPRRLADLVDAATERYRTHGHASPVLLVHTATAPNAVLHTLPVLPRELWAPSLSAVWAAAATITAAYAPGVPADAASLPRPAATPEAALDRAVDHGDEHVIKFTDTAVEAYRRGGHPAALGAAARIATLIT